MESNDNKRNLKCDKEILKRVLTRWLEYTTIFDIEYIFLQIRSKSVERYQSKITIRWQRNLSWFEIDLTSKCSSWWRTYKQYSYWWERKLGIVFNYLIEMAKGLIRYNIDSLFD